MHLDWTTILLLPAAVAGNILEAALAESSPTTSSSPSATQSSLRDIPSAAQTAQELIFAIQTTSPNPAHAPLIGRTYNPNPAFLQPAAALLALDKREIVTGAAQGVAITAVVVPTQVPSITTYWPQSEIGGVATYVQVIYTQTFAAVPQQWPSAGAGSIGFGAAAESSGGSSKERRGEKEERNAATNVGVRIGGVVGAAAVAGLALL